MVIFLSAFARLDTTQTRSLDYLLNFFCIITAAAVLHERLTRFMVQGGVLVLASTLLVAVHEQRAQPVRDLCS